MQSRRFFFYRATPTVDDGKKNRTFRANGSHLALAFSPFAPLIDPDRHKKPYPGVEREKERWFKGEKSERGEHSRSRRHQRSSDSASRRFLSLFLARALWTRRALSLSRSLVLIPPARWNAFTLTCTGKQRTKKKAEEKRRGPALKR